MNNTDKTKLKILTNQQTLLSIRFCPKDSEDGPAKVFHGLYKKRKLCEWNFLQSLISTFI
jgi:hypothetical protein